jgi:hypothetical protein
VLGVDPVKNLVVPRFLALMIITGLFDIFALLFGIFGGVLATLTFGAPLGPFWATFFTNASTVDLWGSVLKCTGFGAIVAIVCCYKGMTASGGAEGVGRGGQPGGRHRDPRCLRVQLRVHADAAGDASRDPGDPVTAALLPAARIARNAVDEAAARRDLRAQIARLDRRLAAACATAPVPRRREAPRGRGCSTSPSSSASATSSRRRSPSRGVRPAAPAPRTATRGCGSRRSSPIRAGTATSASRLHELGLPGCGVYRARPRFGAVGRLAGWWEITLSSGCPLEDDPHRDPVRVAAAAERRDRLAAGHAQRRSPAPRTRRARRPARRRVAAP